MGYFRFKSESESLSFTSTSDIYGIYGIFLRLYNAVYMKCVTQSFTGNTHTM